MYITVKKTDHIAKNGGELKYKHGGIHLNGLIQMFTN